MPIKVPDNLPAKSILAAEQMVFADDYSLSKPNCYMRKIVILNLMPTKLATETQLLRMLGNTPFEVETFFMHPSTYLPKNTPKEHLSSFYLCFDDIRQRSFDGMIITGAPIEQMNFEEVEYWNELKAIMQWTKSNVSSTLHICWGAQAGLYYHYGISKHPLEEKLFGVFPHRVSGKRERLTRGFDDEFHVPHSRYTEIRREDLEKIPSIRILSESEEAGIYIAASTDGKQIFVTGHSEYDPLTLKLEYERDRTKGLDTAIPKNYFPWDLPDSEPIVRWRSHGSLLFCNWLNYYACGEKD